MPGRFGWRWASAARVRRLPFPESLSPVLRPFGTVLECQEGSEGLGGPSSWLAMADRHPVALILEDTDLGRWALTHALQAEGFEVVGVSTWAEASACLTRVECALALIAVSSIVDDVADVVASIRRDHPATHVMLLVQDEGLRELRSRCGPGTDILPKPLNLDDVARVARAWPAAAPPPGA